MNYQKLPPSEMLRVPTALIPAVRELSRLHRQGHTTALLQALEDLIVSFDSNADSTLAPSNKAVQNLEVKLDNIESKLSNKLDAISTNLEQLSRNAGNASKGNYNPRRSKSYYPHQQSSLELEPFAHENLAQRLGLSAQTLLVEREKLSSKEFISYTRNRDPRSFGWQWNESEQLYHPVPV
jgi:hypothetical protein